MKKDVGEGSLVCDLYKVGVEGEGIVISEKLC